MRLPGGPGDHLGRELVAAMPELTHARVTERALANAAANASLVRGGRSLAVLRGRRLGRSSDDAVAVAAGPSISRAGAFDALRAFDGALLCTESSLGALLRSDVVPHLVVTLTGRLAGFDAKLGDATDAGALLRRHGPRLRAAVSTCADPAVAAALASSGAEVAWWNPMLDDPDEADSATRALMADNGLPCVNGGGGVGGVVWTIATEVLGAPRVGLLGYDLGYAEGTPYEETAYFEDAVALVGRDRLDEVYVRVSDPETGATYFTDPASLWYRDALVELTAESASATVNCTPGGALFAPSLPRQSLADFVRRAPIPRRS